MMDKSPNIFRGDPRSGSVLVMTTYLYSKPIG